MMVFLDTSALLAVIDADDSNHSEVEIAWRRLIELEERLLTTSFVLVEVTALVQSRFGMLAARALSEDLLPWIEIEWVGPEIHKVAEAFWLEANRRS
jgi:predicted nucleic acid-binding protein